MSNYNSTHTGTDVDKSVDDTKTINTLTEGVVPVSNGETFTDSPIVVTLEEVQCGRNFYAPEIRTKTGTFKLDDAIAISSNSHSLTICDEARCQRANVVASPFTDSGSGEIEHFELGAVETVPVWTNSSEVLSDFCGSYTVPVVAGRDGVFWRGIVLTAVSVGENELSIIYGGAGGKNLVSEFAFTSAIGDNALEFPNPVFLSNGETICFSFSGVGLVGQTVGAEFRPKLSITDHQLTIESVATQNWTEDYVETVAPNFLSAIGTGTTIIPTTAVVLICNGATSSNNISYNSTTGVFTFQKDGTHSLLFNLSIHNSKSSTIHVELWTEKWNGVGWDEVPNSGVFKEFIREAEGLYSINKGLCSVTSGEQYRIMAKSSSDTALTMESTILSNGVVSPAIRLSITN